MGLDGLDGATPTAERRVSPVRIAFRFERSASSLEEVDGRGGVCKEAATESGEQGRAKGRRLGLGAAS